MQFKKLLHNDNLSRFGKRKRQGPQEQIRLICSTFCNLTADVHNNNRCIFLFSLLLFPCKVLWLPKDFNWIASFLSQFLKHRFLIWPLDHINQGPVGPQFFWRLISTLVNILIIQALH